MLFVGAPFLNTSVRAQVLEVAFASYEHRVISIGFSPVVETRPVGVALAQGLRPAYAAARVAVAIRTDTELAVYHSAVDRGAVVTVRRQHLQHGFLGHEQVHQAPPGPAMDAHVGDLLNQRVIAGFSESN